MKTHVALSPSALVYARPLILKGEMIRQTLSSSRSELETQLRAFEIKVRRGEKGGGGLLGHITEFLVSQRGVTR